MEKKKLYFQTVREIKCTEPIEGIQIGLEVNFHENFEEGFRRDTNKFLINEGDSRYSVLPMFYSMRECWELAKYSKIKFDRIIRTRFDLRIIRKIPEPIIEDIIPLEEILIPDQEHYLGINDQFAIGFTRAMNSYLTIYNWLEELINNGNSKNIHLNPEVLLYKHLLNSNVKINLIPKLYEIER